jgi:hypothetical protein
MVFDDFTSEQLNITHGVDQGCLLSAIRYPFYNAQLVEMVKEVKGEMVIEFIDNIIPIVKGKTFNAAHHKIVNMFGMEGAKKWAEEHCSEFDISKTVVIGFSRKCKKMPRSKKSSLIKQPNLKISRHSIMPVKTAKYLGIILDKELCYKE